MTHIDRGPIQLWSFSGEFIAQWGIGLWTLTIVVFSGVGYMATLLSDEYTNANLGDQYITVAVSILAFFLT